MGAVVTYMGPGKSFSKLRAERGIKCLIVTGTSPRLSNRPVHPPVLRRMTFYWLGKRRFIVAGGGGLPGNREVAHRSRLVGQSDYRSFRCGTGGRCQPFARITGWCLRQTLVFGAGREALGKRGMSVIVSDAPTWRFGRKSGFRLSFRIIFFAIPSAAVRSESGMNGLLLQPGRDDEGLCSPGLHRVTGWAAISFSSRAASSSLVSPSNTRLPAFRMR